ncbi:hypothetical protein [Sphingomonas pruni]|uniref:hypothetical protein n=1 Tax=Sphingomonas pruni TaxID=40683 RepID=UPI000A552B42|nr:hypothetical protein [Sphingomonas pruni]
MNTSPKLVYWVSVANLAQLRAKLSALIRGDFTAGGEGVISPACLDRAWEGGS